MDRKEFKQISLSVTVASSALFGPVQFLLLPPCFRKWFQKATQVICLHIQRGEEKNLALHWEFCSLSSQVKVTFVDGISIQTLLTRGAEVAKETQKRQKKTLQKLTRGFSGSQWKPSLVPETVQFRVCLQVPTENTPSGECLASWIASKKGILPFGFLSSWHRLLLQPDIEKKEENWLYEIHFGLREIEKHPWKLFFSECSKYNEKQDRLDAAFKLTLWNKDWNESLCQSEVVQTVIRQWFVFDTSREILQVLLPVFLVQICLEYNLLEIDRLEVTGRIRNSHTVQLKNSFCFFL